LVRDGTEGMKEEIPVFSFGCQGEVFTICNEKISSFAKAQYVIDEGFGGAFVWSLDLDDFTGQFCAQGNFSLISHLRSALNSGHESILLYSVS